MIILDIRIYCLLIIYKTERLFYLEKIPIYLYELFIIIQLFVNIYYNILNFLFYYLRVKYYR